MLRTEKTVKKKVDRVLRTEKTVKKNIDRVLRTEKPVRRRKGEGKPDKSNVDSEMKLT